MQLNEDSHPGKYKIKSYEPGQIRINDETYTHSLIVSTDELITNWRPEQFNDLKESDFDPILSLKPEVIIIGTGKKLTFIDQKLQFAIQSKKVGLEVMSTESACRTFNVLISEFRQVVAALFPI